MCDAAYDAYAFAQRLEYRDKLQPFDIFSLPIYKTCGTIWAYPGQRHGKYLYIITMFQIDDISVRIVNTCGNVAIWPDIGKSLRMIRLNREVICQQALPCQNECVVHTL